MHHCVHYSDPSFISNLCRDLAVSSLFSLSARFHRRDRVCRAPRAGPPLATFKRDASTWTISSHQARLPVDPRLPRIAHRSRSPTKRYMHLSLAVAQRLTTDEAGVADSLRNADSLDRPAGVGAPAPLAARGADRSAPDYITRMSTHVHTRPGAAGVISGRDQRAQSH